MRLDVSGVLECFGPETAPFGVFGQHCFGVLAAARYEVRVKRAAGWDSGRLVAKVDAPPCAVCKVSCRTMRRVAMHEHRPASLDWNRTRLNIGQQIRPDGGAVRAGDMRKVPELPDSWKYLHAAVFDSRIEHCDPARDNVGVVSL